MLVEREGVTSADPETIWSTCFADPNVWPQWDADVDRMEDVDPTGLVEGAKVTFVMKEPKDLKCPVVCTGVKTNESFTFSGGMAMGLIKFSGTIVLTKKEEKDDVDGNNKTHIDYKFEFSGFLGMIVSAINSTPIIEGTEKGLANIIKMSEEASKK